jgi:hypothetical protein
MEEIASRHHEEQKLIARNVVAALHPVWEVLDFHDLKRTTAPWLKLARPIVEKGLLSSQRAAAEFVRNYRSAAHHNPPTMNFSVPEIGRQTSLKIMASMTVTGPVWMAQRSQPGMDPESIPRIQRDGFSKSTGAVTRMVLNGGRGVVRDLVQLDPLAKGIVSIADPDACNGCLFLTNPIMKSAGEKRMNAVSVGHDFCTCSAKPVY